jgi:riboflavin biosynthesis pyrimidine reductase
VIDKNLRLPQHLQIFNQEQSTIIFEAPPQSLRVLYFPPLGGLRGASPLSFGEGLGGEVNSPLLWRGAGGEVNSGVRLYKISSQNNLIDEILKACCELNIQSVLVEGGAKLLQSFIDKNIWDETRIITNNHLIINEGLDALQLHNAKLQREENIFTDTIQYFVHE